ncbi:uncharacterized protein LACBIDRAFT_313724 [Laccaria bicolor S238N-H82]|uniref:Predicted protein n=1 Tax=Laccaria bicolor (strain S238N-H82 / ATCC MYA-4686) TaxID=486041 RepID=B0D0N8_LACBS|nr:uncharacterized protein LACBIDRAFT_313724 [Laccaria bicolor S238N-H82]EDR11854.1 predicted protein [Laccaria bicolor S238N-H82]|eukprot:XP_001877751.1 predicted protein [Laccaria bicolor S238N-H82]
MHQYFADSKPLWKPRRPADSCADALRRQINPKYGLKLANYHDLHRYSVEDDNFWLELWEFLGIISSVPPQKTKILEKGVLDEVPLWFPGARLNYAENLLHRTDDAIAITATGESGVITNRTFRELRNCVVIALATASIGGIFSSTATDMGTSGILDRYRQITPKFVFAEIEVSYGGKPVDLLPKVTEVIKDLSDKGLQQAVLLPSRITGYEINLQDAASITLSAFLESADDRKLKFEQLPFSQPLFILYSSGTSGKPKCIVHSAGGVLLQTKKDIKMTFDASPEDTYFQYTTTGWMMWTFMLTGLACGSRIILYDGSPFHPDLKTFLQFINNQGVSILGTSPRFLAEIQGKGINPLELGSFEALKTISCTGAVLTLPLFEWAFHAFGGDVHLVSMSGGTDISACFVAGTPSLPVYSGEIQCKSLGMKVEIFDLSGNNIEHLGEPGELVCTRPHPSLPVCFWGDEGGKKFLDAYFSMYPGIWRQGDLIVVNQATKGIMILGRSDGVLNPSGVRFGSAEIYSALEPFSKVIDDSLCIGQRRSYDRDERVLLFVKMRAGYILSPALISQIRITIRRRLSARHVPAYIFEVSDIPYTVNGKKIEIAVKQIVSGSNLQPSGTVANPESLQLYYKYRDIEKVVKMKKDAKL